VSGLSGVSGAWLQVQAPKFAMMVARKEFGDLDHAAWRTTLIGVLVFLAGSCIALGGLLLLEAHRPWIAGRLTSFGSIVLFLIAELLHQVSMVQSTYLRSFKQEPFLGISLVSGFVIGVGTLLLTPAMGAYGPAVSYLLAITIALLWGTAVFVRKRRQWSRPAS
jgi:O-antigen/teichoic acid export membrane protein